MKHLNKITITLAIIVFFSLIFLSVPDFAHASIWEGIKECRDTGDCKLSHLTQLLVNVAQWILGISGSLALLALVYGGVLFLISGSSSETVTKAKKIITGAVIGLIIVFASYTIIAFILNSLGVGGSWSAGSIFS